MDNPNQPIEQQDQEFHEYISTTSYVKGAMDEKAKQQATTVNVEQLWEEYWKLHWEDPVGDYKVKKAYLAGYKQGVKQVSWTDADMIEAFGEGVLRSSHADVWLEQYKKLINNKES